MLSNVKKSFNQSESLSLAEMSTCKVLLPHVQTPRHGPPHAPRTCPHQKKSGRLADMCTPLSIDT